MSRPVIGLLLMECFYGMERNNLNALQKLLLVLVLIPIASETLDLGL